MLQFLRSNYGFTYSNMHMRNCVLLVLSQRMGSFYPRATRLAAVRCARC